MGRRLDTTTDPDLEAIVELSQTDRAYIAGFFDGEGSIGAYKNTHGYALRLSITQRKPSTLLWIQSIFGGALIYNDTDTIRSDGSDRRPYWIWRVDRTDNARIFMRTIKPYLRDKLEQVELAMQFERGAPDKNAEIASELVELKRG